jgi:hypothetical protein
MDPVSASSAKVQDARSPSLAVKEQQRITAITNGQSKPIQFEDLLDVDWGTDANVKTSTNNAFSAPSKKAAPIDKSRLPGALKMVKLTDNYSFESKTNSSLEATEESVEMRDSAKAGGRYKKEENKSTFSTDKKTAPVQNKDKAQQQGQSPDKQKQRAAQYNNNNGNSKQVIEEISEEDYEPMETRSIVYEKIKREKREAEIIDLL